MHRWSGRVALVTGASVGIGASVCKMLLNEGMNVVGIARNVQEIEKHSDGLPEGSGELLALKCDMTKEEEIGNVFKIIKEKFGGVDVVINNAGMSFNKTLLEMDVPEWRYMMDVNVIGLLLCSKLAINSMRERNVDVGHVININSIGGHRIGPLFQLHFYFATKHSVTTITECLRRELRDVGSHIRISSVSPGIVETEFSSRMKNSKDEGQKLYNSLKCLQKEDIADTVKYILTAPPHVEINDLLIRPTEQKS